VPWLLRDGEVLATLEVAESRRDRRHGLRHRDEFEGALLLRPARAIHTFGVRFPLDVAYCDRDLAVLRVATVPPTRLCRPCFRAACVIEAEAGSFARWSLAPGDHLEVKE
jgi:uncharacterized membrane protein (UPF0127 family)